MTRGPVFIALVTALCVGVVPPRATAVEPSSSSGYTVRPVVIPDGDGGIGFDDLGYSPELDKILVPAGRTGNLDLLDPRDETIISIHGFGSAPAGVRGAHGHGEGATSVDFGHGLLFVIDHDSRRLDVVDPGTRTIVSFAALAADPDYVRWVEPTEEIWVTEPGAEQIEVFSLSKDDPPTPLQETVILVPGGPESLVVDVARNLAYTNLWNGTTLAVRLVQHNIAARWDDRCRGARGLALDARRGFLFVGCAEGGATVLDLDHDGKVLDAARCGAGVDIIAYDAERSLLYVPGGHSATLGVLAVSGSGELTLIATVKTARGAHCVTVDDHHQAWICDPGRGRLLRVAGP